MPRTPILLALLFLVLAALAMLRPIDHDESQYVAAALLAAHGLPYRDFAYLQPPLQPLLFAPVALLAGGYAYPVLRLVNAALGVATIAGCYVAARAAGADRPAALLAAATLVVSDIFLFGVGVARNDALPAALFAWSLVPIAQAARGEGSARGALIVGLLLAGAAAAKISYAVPALAYGGAALIDRRHRPAWLIAGALPVAALVGALAFAAPGGFWFDVIGFPARAPAQWYGDTGRAYKLSVTLRIVDTIKFLALGPALLMTALWLRDRRRSRPALMLDLLVLAGLVAALLPQPTWRQYLLPMLVPLAVRLATRWQAAPPGRTLRIALATMAAAGLAPSVDSAIRAADKGIPMHVAVRESAAITQALDAAGIEGPVATLSPQFLISARHPIDPRFAAGPFYFRSTGLLDPDREARFRLIAMATLDRHFARQGAPSAILVGGEGRWSSGDDRIDRVLEGHAIRHGWRRLPLHSHRFRLYAPGRR